jgi:hypothetical protein
MPISPGHYQRGWHITSKCGVFGSAAAAAKTALIRNKPCLVDAMKRDGR